MPTHDCVRGLHVLLQTHSSKVVRDLPLVHVLLTKYHPLKEWLPSAFALRISPTDDGEAQTILGAGVVDSVPLNALLEEKAEPRLVRASNVQQ